MDSGMVMLAGADGSYLGGRLIASPPKRDRCVVFRRFRETGHLVDIWKTWSLAPLQKYVQLTKSPFGVSKVARNCLILDVFWSDAYSGCHVHDKKCCAHRANDCPMMT